MRIAIVGSRVATEAQKKAIYRIVKSHSNDPETVIVTGDAGGVDSYAKFYANVFGLECVVHVADWHVRAKKAGPERNARIVADCTKVYALPGPNSVGTHDTIRQARAAGLEVEVVKP